MARRLERGRPLVLASHNPGKLAEMEALMVGLGIETVSARALGLPTPMETARDFVGNARIKALAASAESGLVALADDSGFCVAALGGAPGIYSARWAGPQGDFASAMARVHREMGERTERRAWFIAALVLAWTDGHTETFLGRVDGVAVWPPRGNMGFGYDPMFQPLGSTLTFGEMGLARKGAMTHRARAFAALKVACLMPVPQDGPG